MMQATIICLFSIKNFGKKEINDFLLNYLNKIIQNLGLNFEWTYILYVTNQYS